MRSLSRALIALLLAGLSLAARADAVAEAIGARIGQLAAAGGLYVRGVALATGSLLPDFYTARGHAPAWDQPARVEELLALLATAPVMAVPLAPLEGDRPGLPGMLASLLALAGVALVAL